MGIQEGMKEGVRAGLGWTFSFEKLTSTESGKLVPVSLLICLCCCSFQAKLSRLKKFPY